MIVTTQKEFSDVLAALGAGRRWVVVGCAECAAICQTGGSAQVEEMARRLEDAGREVLAQVSLASPCDRRLSRRDLRHVEAELRAADGVLCLSCGGGVQAVAGLVDRPVVAGLDAHFAGTVERLGVFHEECALCGDCLLNETAGTCPVALCPKGLRNGPCEGSHDGRCEADAEAECVWERIHARLAEAGSEECFTAFHRAPDPNRWGRPRTTRAPAGGAR
ncbi:MAG: methylenetetrahydrofolate reductase C-terminal domain-containing protein [Deltaproteobacteria bacterium]|nr:methylenetetrahydrofolate reductase C-terminal domain-containing protein [Deltaproteobacteria bacterium]